MGRIGFAFLLGHCCVHALARLPSLEWAPVLGGALALAAACRWKLIAALLLGIGSAWGHAAARLAGDLPTALEGRELLIRGHVVSIPQEIAGDSQFLFRVDAAAPGVPARIRLTWYRAAAHPRAGEPWQLLVRLKRRNGLANPGGFDLEGYLFREAIGAVGYVRADARNHMLPGTSSCCFVLQARATIATRMALAVGDNRMLGVLQGLAIGDAQQVPAEQWRVFAATGTTHLMAISGLHITMIAALAAWLGGAIVRWPGAQRRAWNAMHGQVVAAAGGAIVYSAIAGMSLPTQRTLIMLCLWFASRLWRRVVTPGHALGLALIAVLVADPFAPLAVGAWLSFAAVAVILLVVCGRLGRDSVLAGFTRVQLAVTIGLVPLLLTAFGGVSLISPLANALAVPLFTLLVVPSVLLGALAALVYPAAGTVLLAVPATLLEWVWPLFDWMADQPLAIAYLPAPTLPQLVALTIGALLLLLPGIWPTRLLGVLLCIPAVAHRPVTPRNGDFDLAVLDVGQGLSVVVRTRAHVLVYDAGPAFRSGRDAGVLAVLPYLRQLGVRSLDALVVSHADVDHRGGVASIVAGLDAHVVLAGPTLRPYIRHMTTCRAGQVWTWDEVEFEVLHPADAGGIDAGRANDNGTSCVLRISGHATSGLLTGDIESDTEAALVARGLAPADVVVVAHHGSRTSSSAAFVEALHPRFALISVGYRNRWGFPAAEVRARWQGAGARTLTTSDSGAIEVSFAGEAVKVREHRRAHARYWHR
jgi:competence protein ComEC